GRDETGSTGGGGEGRREVGGGGGWVGTVEVGLVLSRRHHRRPRPPCRVQNGAMPLFRCVWDETEAGTRELQQPSRQTFGGDENDPFNLHSDHLSATHHP